MADEPRSRLEALRHQVQSWWDDSAVAVAEQGHRSRPRAFVHFWVLVGRSFVRNRGPLRASALAYSSLLAMIPMLALVLSVTTSILKSQGEAPIKAFVDTLVQSVTPYVSPQDAGRTGNGLDAAGAAEVARARDEAVKKIHEFISRTQTGAIGGTSAFVLLIVAITMLTRIEDTFNDIWGVARGRSWYMRVVLYWAAITLGPIVLISALGLATAGQIHFAQSNPLHFLTAMPLVTSLVSACLPVLVLSLAFAMIYLLLPNTRVHFSAALIGGLTSGVLWQANNLLGVYFVSRFTSNAAVYGGLAMVPVLMIGLYIGWVILLFGAQVAYAFQNRAAYLQERLAENVSQSGREFAAVQIMTRLAQCFHHQEAPPTSTELARHCGIPTRLVVQLLARLSQARLVFEVHDRETRFAPARPLDQMNVQHVLHALRHGKPQPSSPVDDPGRQMLRQSMARVEDASRAAAQSLTLLSLVQTADSSTQPPGVPLGTAPSTL